MEDRNRIRLVFRQLDLRCKSSDALAEGEEGIHLKLIKRRRGWKLKCPVGETNGSLNHYILAVIVTAIKKSVYGYIYAFEKFFQFASWRGTK